MGVCPGQDLLRVALAQINATVGDIDGNAAQDRRADRRGPRGGRRAGRLPRARAERLPARGPAAEDLVPRGRAAALGELAAQTHGIVALVGFPESAEDVYNAAAVLADGEVAAVYRKMYLPNYGVFDEQRYFQTGAEAGIFELNGIPIGVSICEDIWEPGPPAMTEALAGRSGDRQPVGVAVPDRLRARARAHARAARRRQPRRRRLREHRRRPGRARLRRAQPRRRPGRARAGPLRPVRGEPHALHDRPARGHLGAPARHPPPRQRAPPAPRRADRGAARRSTWRASRWPAAARTVGGEVADLLEPEAEVYAALRTGLRDYVARTGSSTSCWACRAASTPRWWRCVAATRSAPRA